MIPNYFENEGVVFPILPVPTYDFITEQYQFSPYMSIDNYYYYIYITIFPVDIDMVSL